MPPDTRVDELESGDPRVCEPIFDRPLKEISLGQVLLRLFQTSRRFNVEIQPQLVLLQKTLLNVEGLGRQLDPDLDLWMHRQAVPRALDGRADRLARARATAARRGAVRSSQLLPELPRLLHQRLTAQRAASERGDARARRSAAHAQPLARADRAAVSPSRQVVVLLVAMAGRWRLKAGSETTGNAARLVAGRRYESRLGPLQ